MKKSEIYGALWKSCDELRGGMDASQYKDYILTLLFVKYVSDKYAGDKYADIVVSPKASFAHLVSLKGQKEIGEEINKATALLDEENKLKGVIKVADFNDVSKLGDGKELVDRLTRLIGIFESLDFSRNRADGDDLLGDAYEYLMRHFATQSGKSKGQFYTPAEVSRVIAQVIGIDADTKQDKTVYDPTCGSGSLLLKAAEQAPNGLTIYGQEIDLATAGLAQMNMILHGKTGAEISRGNTLADPKFIDREGNLQRFDFAVANPPFSTKSWSNGLIPKQDEYHRFEWGVPPDKNGDYAFFLHLVHSLNSAGKGAIILPHGVLFRGNAEAVIRRRLLQEGLIKGVIGLPANLFYGTGIPACIIVIDKENASERKDLFMIDASKGFFKDGAKNRLREQDIHKIVDVFNRQQDVPGYARRVPLDEIADPKNDYNLNIPRYIDGGAGEDLHDLTAHLQGGIPNRDVDALADYWRVFPGLRAQLFDDNGREGYSAARVEASEVRQTVMDAPEYSAFRQRALDALDGWQQAQRPFLESELKADMSLKPKQVISRLSEDLLKGFAAVDLISRYDVYQLLMDYWAETMADDVFLIGQQGWKARIRPVEPDEEPDFTLGSGKKAQKFKAELLPPAVVAARFFASQEAELAEREARAETLAQQIEELEEEHNTEDGLLAEVADEKGKISKANVNARIKQIKRNPDEAEELALLTQYLELSEAEAEARKTAKLARAALDLRIMEQYARLSEAETRELTIAAKWFAHLEAGVADLAERVTQRLTARVKELEERYADPLPDLTARAEELEWKVKTHLARMGLTL